MHFLDPSDLVNEPRLSTYKDALQTHVTIEEILRPMPGGAQSVLARCDAGFFVIKRHHHQGPNVLANEVIGTELMRTVGLPVPSWRIASVAWPDTSREEQPLYFASEYTRSATGLRTFEILPSRLVDQIANRADFLGAFVFDLWAGSRDVRQALYLERANHKFDAVFIDQGHMFGGPSWHEKLQLCEWSRDFLCYPDIWRVEVASWAQRLQDTIPSALPESVALVPKCWYSGDIVDLSKRLLARLPGLEETALRTFEARYSQAALNLWRTRCSNYVLTEGSLA